MGFLTMTKRYFSFFIILMLSCNAADFAQAQTFDYESYPKMDFTIEHMELDLAVNPDEMNVAGEVSYRVSGNIKGAETLVLNAAGIQIKTVTADNIDVPFSLRNDSLLIELTEATNLNQVYTVTVTYDASPEFGLLKNSEGYLWTSLLPGSTRHWLPVTDHPRAAFPSNVSLTVPSGYEVVATGMQMDRKVNASNQVEFIFRTEQQVPVSALSFAVGKFEREQTSFGLKRITLLNQPNIQSQEEKRRILKSAVAILREVQNVTERGFPFEGLNIVILKDHFWETKSWGASTVFLYENRGDLEAQLRRGIYGQWFGVYQREEQWQNAEALSLYQTALHYRLIDSSAMLKESDVPGQIPNTPYDTYNISKWNSQQLGFLQWEDSLRKNILNRTVSNVLTLGNKVFTYNDYARFWYEQTGQPLFEVPYARFQMDADTADTDSIRYRVAYNLNEVENSLKLKFTAEKGVYKELVTLPLVQVALGESTTSEVSFTGAEDSVLVNVSPMTDDAYIDASSRPKLELVQHRPVPYLIYVLRSEASTARQKEAAEMLGEYTDNPDLQLAIGDLMKKEDLAPEVKAALLKSLGAITNGAEGTEQVFLDRLNADNPDIRQAGLMALVRYEGSDRVRKAVESFTLESDSLPTYRKSLKVLSAISDTSTFDGFIRQIVSSDTSGHRAVYAIKEWADMGRSDRAVRQVEFYISDTYDFPVRKAALQVLMQHDHTPENWRKRAQKLLNDIDPRIRFLTVRALSKVNGLSPNEILSSHMDEEFDARVYRLMERVMKE